MVCMRQKVPNPMNDVYNENRRQPKARKLNKSKATQRKNNKISTEQQTENNLSAKLFATIEKHKETFFVIRLHSPQSAASLAPIEDPDPLLICELMDERDAFVSLSRVAYYEFSSLRRAKFSTLCMLYELHNPSEDKFVYTCDNCENRMETGYHCKDCDNFDLCIDCKKKIDHVHEMEKVGHGSSPSEQQCNPEVNPQALCLQSIQKCVQLFVHAFQCSETNCTLLSCQTVKHLVGHTKWCKRKTDSSCSICKKIIAICCYHAKHCQDTNCPILFCRKIKIRLKQLESRQRSDIVSFSPAAFHSGNELMQQIPQQQQASQQTTFGKHISPQPHHQEYPVMKQIPPSPYPWNSERNESFSSQPHELHQSPSNNQQNGVHP